MSFTKLLLLICSITVIAGGYLWYTQMVVSHSTAYADIKKHLSATILLPDDEPTIAAITDAETLKKKDPFYRNALNNDLVVIWKEKAIIYRPSIGRVIDWGITVK